MDENELGYDLTFELNEFNQPRIRSELELIKNALLYILFSKPGQYPSIPTLGLDIESLLYSYYDEIDEEELKTQIIEQCSILGCFFTNGVINIAKTVRNGNPILVILITGVESFPDGYMRDNVRENDKLLIGITFNELKEMIYDIKNIQ